MLALAIAAYLFLRRKRRPADMAQGVQRLEFRLSESLTPAEARVRSGQRAQLVIHRYDREPADELFEIEALNVYELLPALHTTIIAISPEKRGRFPIVIGGEKTAGWLIVE